MTLHIRGRVRNWRHLVNAGAQGPQFDIDSPIYDFWPAMGLTGGFTFSRPSGAPWLDLDNDGDYDSVANDTMRLYTAGTLAGYGVIDGARQNVWVNNDWTGFTAGSPGVVAADMFLTAGGDGLTRFLAKGVDTDGLPYLDVRIAGTASAQRTFLLTVSGANYPAAVAGTATTFSAILKLQAGTLTGISSVKLRSNGLTSADAVVAFGETTVALTGSDQLATQPYTLTGGTAAKWVPQIRIDCADGGVIDVTVRIKGVGALFQPVALQGVIPTSGVATTTLAETLVRTCTEAEMQQGTVIVDWYNAHTTVPAGLKRQSIWHYSEFPNAFRLAIIRFIGATNNGAVRAFYGDAVAKYTGGSPPTVGAKRYLLSWGSEGWVLAANGMVLGSGSETMAASGSTTEVIGGQINVTGGTLPTHRFLPRRVRRFPGQCSQAEAVVASAL